LSCIVQLRFDNCCIKGTFDLICTAGCVEGVQCGLPQSGRSSEAGPDVSTRCRVVDSLLYAGTGRRRLHSGPGSQHPDNAHLPRPADHIARPHRPLRQSVARQTRRQSVRVSARRVSFIQLSFTK